MLINLSNHPSEKWTKKQLNEAISQYQEVIDLPFPAIDPDWTTAEVASLAEEYAQKIRAKQPQAVHLMGEMNFTFALVTLLQRAAIACVASTSKRMVLEEADGKKTVRFHFVQFRPYR